MVNIEFLPTFTDNSGRTVTAHKLQVPAMCLYSEKINGITVDCRAAATTRYLITKGKTSYTSRRCDKHPWK